MTATYSGNPAKSDLDKYRFLIGDTEPTDAILSDEEITFILSSSTSENKILCELFEAMANAFARSDIKKSLGPQSVDPTERKKYFENKATYYRRLSTSSGISVPTYKTKNAFYKGIMTLAGLKTRRRVI
jgi:hypothetical protein